MSPDQQAALWARTILQKNPVVLDTETTGMDGSAEICQIAIIDTDGNTLLDTLVRPTCVIPRDAIRVHGITNEMIKDAPVWLNVAGTVRDLIEKRPVVIYNAQYDLKLLRQSSASAGDTHKWSLIAASYDCAMLQYAKFWAEWNDYRGDWAWQTLDKAMRQQQLPRSGSPGTQRAR